VSTDEAARRWAEVWERGWREHDVDAIVGLYGEEAVFRSAPFREAKRGRVGVREYVEWAFADEEPGGEIRFGGPFVAGDRVLVEYWAVVTSGGDTQTIAGISVLRFDGDGLVVEQRDYWHAEEGARRPAPEWGA
jgi:ketosteroid isomerase-like protein